MAKPYRLDRYRLQEYSLSGADGSLFDKSLIVSDTATKLCKLGTRNYYKTTNEWSIVAYAFDGTYTGPILVGLTPTSVNYQGGGATQTYSGSLVYKGTTYYYGSTGYWMSGNLTDTSGLVRTKLTATTAKYPTWAVELLDRYTHDNGY